MNKGKGVDVSRIDNLIINEDVKTPIGEAYRTIRTNIQFSIPKVSLSRPVHSRMSRSI
jgi:hypothetical protein